MKKFLIGLILSLCLASTVNAACSRADLTGAWIMYIGGGIMPSRCYVTIPASGNGSSICATPGDASTYTYSFPIAIASSCAISATMSVEKITATMSRDKLNFNGLYYIPGINRGNLLTAVKL